MFKKLEKWLNDYEEAMFKELMGLKKEIEYAKPIIRKQLNNGKQCLYDLNELKEKFPGYASWMMPERYELRVVSDSFWNKNAYYLDAIVNIGGKDYNHTVMYHTANYRIEPNKLSALNQYVFDKGYNPKDIELIEGRDEEWISRFCAKEKEAKRKYIEAKVEKICGKELEEVSGECVGDLYVKGNNGKIAHIWAITAGGYNTDVIVNVKHGQRRHIRILVKEIK